MSVMSTGAPASSFAASRPPNPPPTITTRWRAGEQGGFFIGSLVRWSTGRRQHGHGAPCLETANACRPKMNQLCAWRDAQMPECVPCFRLLGYTRQIQYASETSKMTQGGHFGRCYSTSWLAVAD